MISLTKEQRKFLEYLKENHRCFGYTGTIPEILAADGYSETEREYLNGLVATWRSGRTNTRLMNSYGGLPTKYLK